MKLAEKTKPLKKELEQIDKDLHACATEKFKLEAAMSSASTTPAKGAEHGKKLKQVNDKVEKLEQRWLEVTERIEAM